MGHTIKMQRTKCMELKKKTNTRFLEIDDQEYERVKKCKHQGTVLQKIMILQK
jgi:hypothetical protein